MPIVEVLLSRLRKKLKLHGQS